MLCYDVYSVATKHSKFPFMIILIAMVEIITHAHCACIAIAVTMAAFDSIGLIRRLTSLSWNPRNTLTIRRLKGSLTERYSIWHFDLMN